MMAQFAKNGSKLYTGLTGMEVIKTPHHILGVIYSRTLRALAKMPSDYPYRVETEKVILNRAKLVKETPDIESLEKKINAGQIEEVVIQADNELMLARNMLQWKTWEPLVNQPPKNQWKWPL